MFRRPLVSCRAGIVLAVVTLAACSPSSQDSAQQSSSAGLPDGRSGIGDSLAQAKGKATGQSCIDCHGRDGNAPIDPSYPRLGGQYPDYLAHALQAYRRGDRQHPLMTPQAAALSDQEIADLAAYFGSRRGSLRDLQGIK